MTVNAETLVLKVREIAAERAVEHDIRDKWDVLSVKTLEQLRVWGETTNSLIVTSMVDDHSMVDSEATICVDLALEALGYDAMEEQVLMEYNQASDSLFIWLNGLVPIMSAAR